MRDAREALDFDLALATRAEHEEQAALGELMNGAGEGSVIAAILHLLQRR